MFYNINKKSLNIFLLTYLIFVLTCSSAISAAEAFGNEYSNNNNHNSNTYFSSVGHSIGWLVKVTFKKTTGNSNSRIRSKFFRLFTFAGIIAMVIYLMRVNLKNKNNKIQTVKNLVLLKLRI
jgi:CHASE3 domain sensor protein